MKNLFEVFQVQTELGRVVIPIVLVGALYGSLYTSFHSNGLIAPPSERSKAVACISAFLERIQKASADRIITAAEKFDGETEQTLVVRSLANHDARLSPLFELTLPLLLVLLFAGWAGVVVFDLMADTPWRSTVTGVAWAFNFICYAVLSFLVATYGGSWLDVLAL